LLKTKTVGSLAAEDPADAVGTYERARRIAAAALVALSCFLILLPLFPVRVAEPLAAYFVLRQDLPLVPLFFAVLLVRANVRGAPLPVASVHARLAVCLAMIVILSAGWAGHYLVFDAYDFSRDEKMAVFDQDIFANGRLLWPIPLEWRPLADALNRLFILPIGDREFWVSAYLPVHAAFRAAMSKIGIAALASPFMAALGAYCTWLIVRKLWPDSNRTALVSLLLLATSSQVMITSMTAFSMSMHMGLNMLWLALFLTDRPRTHAAAILVGFLATGIHQPLFHPLFVLPFLALLVGQRRWKLLASYIGCYVAIGSFWMLWPSWIASNGTANAVAICATRNCESIGFLERLLAVLAPPDWQSAWLTAANLLRFLVWQNPLLAPLALAGAVSCWREDPLVRALTASFILPIIVLFFLLPWQGHGWGYRYVHPAMGSAIILACFGYRHLEMKSVSVRRPLMIASALAAVLLPLHAWMAARMVRPFVQIHAELTAIPADAVIVDTDVPLGNDVVYNRYDLSNRPKLLIGFFVKPEDLGQLCRHSTIAFVDARRLAPISTMFGSAVPMKAAPHMLELREAARRLGCRVVE
jgi:hypothetical protein